MEQRRTLSMDHHGQGTAIDLSWAMVTKKRMKPGKFQKMVQTFKKGLQKLHFSFPRCCEAAPQSCEVHLPHSTSPFLSPPFERRVLSIIIITMDNIAPANIDPAELPAGFSTSDPNAGIATPQQQQAEQKQAAVDQQREAVLEQALTAEALARLRRIKMVKEQKAKSVENAIVAMALSGKLPGPITEGKLIEMLERGNATATSSTARMNSTTSNSSNGPGSIQIQRKNYGRMDSSDDDDNDDDLL
jgi:programmed cell death protein 5